MDKHPMHSAPHGSTSADLRPAVAIFRGPLFNASETFVRAHALSLARYRPVLVGLEDKGNIPPELAPSAYLPGGMAERTRNRLGDVSGLAKRLGSEKPLLIHAHFAPDALTAVPLARALGVPLVATLHGYDVTRSRARMLLSGRLSWVHYALRQATLFRAGAQFLAVSDALRQVALARGFPAERTQTHYLGVDLARFGGSEDREPGLVLHVGRLVEKKGTTVLLQAIAKLPDARLLVIGDGPLRSALERQAAGLGVRVRFLGNLPASEVAAWMRRASLLAAPSVTARDGDAEGLPTAIVEAAASSLPVVATRHSGIPEAVRDGETGFLMPEREPEALAARIAILLESPDIRGRMGAAARRLAEERFDLAVQAERLEAIYDGLAGQTRS